MLLVHQISLKLVHKNIVSVRFYCLLQRRRKYEENLGTRISGTAGAISFKFGM